MSSLCSYHPHAPCHLRSYIYAVQLPTSPKLVGSKVEHLLACHPTEPEYLLSVFFSTVRGRLWGRLMLRYAFIILHRHPCWNCCLEATALLASGYVASTFRVQCPLVPKALYPHIAKHNSYSQGLSEWEQFWVLYRYFSHLLSIKVGYNS